MNTIRLCHNCGMPLPTDAPGGLCPQCLLKSDPEIQSGGGPGHSSAPRVTPVPGQQFGEYRIVRLLGRGGMGEVYEAVQAGTGRSVALKVMSHALSSEQD